MQPIFIVGVARSGTTLLRSLLSAHSRITVTPETHFMIRADKWGLREQAAPQDFGAFWNAYTRWSRFEHLGVEPERCLALIDQRGERSFQNIFAGVLSAYGERLGKARVGEKTPGHVHYLSHLLSWFPQARVLIVRRDPRAAVASQLRSPWLTTQRTPPSLRHGLVAGSRLTQVAHAAEDWAQIYGQVAPAWGDDPRVRVVSYETLVQETAGELESICAFLDEPFEPTMLTDRNDQNVPMPTGWTKISDDGWRQWRQEHHAQSLRPVSADSLEKWKAELGETERAMVEGCCAAAMIDCGYEPALPRHRRRAGRLLAQVALGVRHAEVRCRALTGRTAPGRFLKRHFA